jgi:nickel-type superoxide dismutase maturation protease
MGRVSLRRAGIDGRDHLIQAVAVTNRPLRSRARAPLAVAAASAVLLGLLRLAGLGRVVVEGRSMEPTLAPGDRLLVARARRPRPGDLVAVRDPRQPQRLLVKRVVSAEGGRLVLRGDNDAASTDSRSFGPVPGRLVRGRVLRRYAPASRRGRVG